MTYKVNVAPTPPASPISQTIFIFVGLAIITGGLWSLYMSDAPYHPDVSVIEGGIILATE